MEKDIFPSAKEPIPQEVQNIATPEIVPEPPNLSNIPKEALQSGVIETLLAQNEDLMARLRVQIRRSHLYESEIQQLRSEREKRQTLYHNLQDQLAIWKEKEERWLEKIQKAENFSNKIESDFGWLELRYAELTNSKMESEARLKANMSELESQLKWTQRFVGRVRRNVRPYIEHLKDQISQFQSQTLEQEEHSNQQQQNVHRLEGALAQLQSDFRELQQKQKVERNRLTEIHEQELIDHKSELEHLRGLNSKMSLKLKDFDNVVERSALLENKLIHSKRKRQLLEEQSLIDSEKGKAALLQLKKEISGFEERDSEMQSRNTRLERETKEKTEQLAKMQQQVDVLRKTCAEQLDQNKRLREKMGHLEKLNQSFSEKISLQFAKPELTVQEEGASKVAKKDPNAENCES